MYGYIITVECLVIVYLLQLFLFWLVLWGESSTNFSFVVYIAKALSTFFYSDQNCSYFYSYSYLDECSILFLSTSFYQQKNVQYIQSYQVCFQRLCFVACDEVSERVHQSVFRSSMWTFARSQKEAKWSFCWCSFNEM